MDIKAINKELAKIGYKAVKLPKPKNAALSWKPQTAAGRACRAAMLYWASWPKPNPSPKLSQFDIVAKLVRKAKRRLVDPRSWAYVYEPKGLYVASIARQDVIQIEA